MSNKNEFLKNYMEECIDFLLKKVREWGADDSDWEYVSKRLRPKDIDFIREYKDYIHWDSLSKDVKFNYKIHQEFEYEIERTLQEKIEFNSQLIELIMEI